MRKIILSLIMCLLLVSSARSQDQEQIKANTYLDKKGEVYVNFSIKSREELIQVTKLVSIDHVDGLSISAYANRKQLKDLVDGGYAYTVLKHPTELTPAPKMYQAGRKATFPFDAYPTYSAYVEIMNQFAATYPSLCKVVDIGSSVNGRRLLFVKISDNINANEGEPKFMYTSTMHGDETAGYVLMLRLIDHLLSNYNSVAEVKNLVDNLEIWINPLANPDGTYAGGNNTVAQAKRYNANNVDLNRNFPDPVEGQHPDGNPWQIETQAFMTLAEQNNFVLAANFHGGAEVVNYPWDSQAARHPQDAYFQSISREYADLAQTHGPAGYMDDLNDGITNGWDWYPVSGGRQDYMTHFRNCKEVTIELSNTKLLPASQLIAHWNYNYRSLLAYMKRALGNSLPLPGVASNPNPSNNATNVSTSTTLSWSGGSNATSHDVYFGTTNPPTFRINQTGTSYNPGALTANTTYYWRVDEKNATGTTAGAVWRFTTATGGGSNRIDRTDAGGTITARGENASANEGKDKAFDNSTSTKWLDVSATSWIQFQFAGGNRYACTEYTITSANDAQQRDPKSWTLKGSNDGASWTTLDSRSNVAFTARFQKLTFTFSNTTQYGYYRLDNITNNSGTLIQLAEIEFVEYTGGTTPLPGLATNPNPSNGATSVSSSAMLSWSAGSNASSHDVYFGTSNPPTFRGNQSGTSYNPGALATSTTYYWRVDEKNVTGTTTGSTWSFITGTGGSTFITAESEDNGSATSADGPVGNNINVTGSITSGTDADWYTFTVGTAGSINISVLIGNSSDLDWYLYTASNTSSDVARGYSTSNPEVGNYNASPGKYYLRVVGYNGATGGYTLTINGALTKVEEANLFPVPLENTSVLELSGDPETTVSIEVLDENGNFVAKVFEGRMPKDGLLRKELSAGNFKNGRYILSIKREGKITTQRFVVDK
jgi:hypothetical protein